MEVVCYFLDKFFYWVRFTRGWIIGRVGYAEGGFFIGDNVHIDVVATYSNISDDLVEYISDLFVRSRWW